MAISCTTLMSNPTASISNSGDQEPGSKVDVAFTELGNFTVLCGIHPKMKLVVHVN